MADTHLGTRHHQAAPRTPETIQHIQFDRVIQIIPLDLVSGRFAQEEAMMVRPGDNENLIAW